MERYHNEDLLGLTSFAEVQALLARREARDVSELEPYEDT